MRSISFSGWRIIQIFAILITFLFLTSGAFADDTVVFTDGTFNNADWTVTTLSQRCTGDCGTITAFQVNDGGNPGDYRRIENNLLQPGNLSGFHMKEDAVFDPSTQGAILSIDYSEDWILFYGHRQATSLAIIQNGMYYQATPFAGTYETTWTNSLTTHGLWTSLEAEDFVSYFPPNDRYPDFSTNGALIRFGFFRENHDGTYSNAAGIDNWLVSITYAPINEPPIADAGPDAVVFDEVTLDGSYSYDPDGSIDSYEWKLEHMEDSAYDRFADGERPTISELEPGFYNVTLTVTDNDGSENTDTMLLAAAGPCDGWPQTNADFNLKKFKITKFKKWNYTIMTMFGTIELPPELNLGDGDIVDSRITIELFDALPDGHLVMSDEATLTVRDRKYRFVIKK